MIVMYVIIESSINADGFGIIIQGENRLYDHKYNYGYDASYSKKFAEENKPFTTDILVKLANTYNVEKIIVTAGKNIFIDKPITNDKVNEFIHDYIVNNSQLSNLTREQL